MLILAFYYCSSRFSAWSCDTFCKIHWLCSAKFISRDQLAFTCVLGCSPGQLRPEPLYSNVNCRAYWQVHAESTEYYDGLFWCLIDWLIDVIHWRWLVATWRWKLTPCGNFSLIQVGNIHSNVPYIVCINHISFNNLLIWISFKDWTFQCDFIIDFDLNNVIMVMLQVCFNVR